MGGPRLAAQPMHSPRLSILVALLVLAGCVTSPAASGSPSGGASQPPTAASTGPSAGGAPSAAPPPAGGISGACEVITEDEAAAILGQPIVLVSEDPANATIDIWIGPLTGCGFVTGGLPLTSLVAGYVENGQAQFDQVKAATPNSESLTGIGDDAFASDQTGQGSGPFLLGARKGGTCIYLYTVAGTSAMYTQLKALLAFAASRI